MPFLADRSRASRAAAHGNDLPELRPLAPHDRGPERRLWPAAQGGRVEDRARGARQGHAEGRPARRLRVALSGGTLRRPAAAGRGGSGAGGGAGDPPPRRASERSEEHTSELQSLAYLVCRLLLEKKK